MQVAGNDFLVAPGRLDDLPRREIRHRRQRPHLRDERGQAIAVGGGHGTAFDRQAGGGEHAVARRPRRAGSGGTW